MTDREEIEAAVASFAASYHSGDAAAVLDYYTEDLVKLRQGSPPESKAELGRRLAEVFRRYRTEVTVDNVEVEVSGTLAFTRGTFVVHLTPKDGGEMTAVPRRYLEIWRKAGGRWRVARTMDNEG